MKLGKLGVWQSTDGMTSEQAAAFAQRLEGWGYAAWWMPEARGRNPLAMAGFLLARTTRLVIATGIANIYARDAQATRAAQLGLAEQSGGRFLLGLGVSHVPMVEGLRGHAYGKPVATMRAYLEAMDKAGYAAPMPAEPPKTVLAALGPKMLELAAAKADGAHPFLVTPAHTARARAALGPGKLLYPEQKVILATDAASARKTARAALARYLALENYRNNLLGLGFGLGELEGGGSDRLVDALVAWGDAGAIRARIDEHLRAGADHVCIQALRGEGDMAVGPDETLLAALAPGFA
ncbi:TIGR03620 family F420-dependent LLM class oxidoreductase [Desertibaculum subflavum]|uniref:TIGR03620 family F420-dependent LLM class oxidoreductase n=1 Tax=Desertibaculum subflavum TaxID=2268458 RepID=UPI000E6655A7